MIGTIDIELQAARPDFPLPAITAFVGSPSNLRIRNVPRKVGKWDITKVYVTANFPDNRSASVECVLVGGVYVATISASTAVGISTNGYSVTADGVDERGNSVAGYVLGKGDVVIVKKDGTITVGDTTYYVHLLDSAPTTPHKGDLCKIDGVYKLYDGSAWVAFGGGGGTPSDYETVKANAATGATHAGKTDNPHGVTAAQVGADAAGSAAAAKAAAIADAASKYLKVTQTDEKVETDTGGKAFVTKQAIFTDSTVYIGTGVEQDDAYVYMPMPGEVVFSGDLAHPVTGISVDGVPPCEPEPTGDCDISFLFGSDNTALQETVASGITGDETVTTLAGVKSALFAGADFYQSVDNKAGTSATLDDRQTSTVGYDSETMASGLAVNFTAAKGTELRYCELIITGAPANLDMTFDASVSLLYAGDSFPKTEAGINLYTFAETVRGTWLVSRQTLKSITTPTAS